MGLTGQGMKIATATSTQPFIMGGETINPNGVPSWPVVAWTEIGAGSEPVTLTFADGSKVSLAPGSRARIEERGGKAVFRLLRGEAAYELQDQGSLFLLAADKQVKITDLRGAYVVGGARGGGGFWTGRNMALVFGGAAATATGIGIAATRTPDSVSPSR